jgi:hypothetical protein
MPDIIISVRPKLISFNKVKFPDPPLMAPFTATLPIQMGNKSTFFFASCRCFSSGSYSPQKPEAPPVAVFVILRLWYLRNTGKNRKGKS